MARSSGIDFEDVTKNLAKQLSNDDHIEALGKAFGITRKEVSRYININYKCRGIGTLGTEQMIEKWIEERPPYSDILSDLRSCLVQAKLVRISETIPEASTIKAVSAISKPPVGSLKDKTHVANKSSKSVRAVLQHTNGRVSENIVVPGDYVCFPTPRGTIELSIFPVDGSNFGKVAAKLLSKSDISYIVKETDNHLYLVKAKYGKIMQEA